MNKFLTLDPAIQRVLSGTVISAIPAVITGSYTICLSTPLTLVVSEIADKTFKLDGQRIFVSAATGLGIGALVSKYLDGRSSMLFDALMTMGAATTADFIHPYYALPNVTHPARAIPEILGPHKWSRTNEYTDDKGRHIVQIDGNGVEYYREDIKDGTTVTSGYVIDSGWAIKTGVIPDKDGKFTHTSTFGLFPEPLTINTLM